MGVELMEATEVVSAPIRRLPWAGIATGKATDDELLTSEQMLQRANLDWEVGIRPFQRTVGSQKAVIGGEWCQVDGERVLAGGTEVTIPLVETSKKMMETYRKDTGAELGAVRHRYEVLQNREAFTFGDSLIENGTARWAEAGMQNGGNRVFMTMLLNEQFQVLGQEPFQTYVFMSTSHDGGRSLRVFVTPIRVWCANQTAAVQADNLGSFTIQHTTSMHDKLESVSEVLRRSGEYRIALQEEAEMLATTTVTEEKARYLVTSLIPQRRSKRDQMIEDIISNLKNSPNLEGHRDDGWGLVQAASEYMQHLKPQRSDNARFESITFGEGMKLQYNLARELAHLS
jgi:phage/plasmid-like protein (TIGR03299 family)